VIVVAVAAVAAAIVGSYACADATTDESEAYSDVNVDEATLDADASGPVVIVANVRIAAVVAAVVAAAVAAAKAEKYRPAHIAETVAPNRSSLNDSIHSRDYC